MDTRPETLPFETLGRGYTAHLVDSTATEVAIRDAATWQAYTDSLVVVAPFKPVSFDASLVLLLAVGRRTSGYAVDVASIEKADSVVLVNYVISAPGEDCLTASAETMPFIAVQVPRFDAGVRFDHRIEEYNCTNRMR